LAAPAKRASAQNAGFRQAVGAGQSRDERLHFPETFDGASQFGCTLQGGTQSETIERTLSGAVRGHQKGFKAFLLGRRDRDGETTPQSLARSGTNLGSRPLQRGGAGQQHLVCNQPCRGAVEQAAWSIATGPAQGIKPTIQPELCEGG